MLDQIDEIFEWDVKDDECLLHVRLSGTNQKGWLPIEVSFFLIRYFFVLRNQNKIRII